jgi:hypothetical protein
MNRSIVQNWNNKGSWDPCSLYEHRLDWLEDKVRQHRSNNLDHSEEQYQRWWDDEERVYQNNLKDLKKIKKLEKDTAIIVPSHVYQLVWLRSCLECCQETGYFTLLAYDNPFYSKDLLVERRMPSAETTMMADSMIMKHKSWASGVGIPHAWNMWYSLHLLQGFKFKYVFCINGDCIMENPKGIEELKSMMEDNDIISCEFRPDKKYMGTLAYLSRLDLMIEIWDQYIEYLYHFNIGNAEARTGKWALDRKAKIYPVVNLPEQRSDENFVKNDSTFCKTIGLRHLHAEHKIRREQKREPVEEKYFDFGRNNCFINGHEQTTLIQYWKTKDRNFLKAWWK